MLKTRDGFLKKFLAVSTIFIVFGLGSACADRGLIPVTGINPKAQPLLDTMTAIAKTVEGLAGSATAYAATYTPSPIPTATPNENEIRNLISNAIKDKLISSLGVKITVGDVKFGPVGAQKYTDLYIEMNCVSDNNNVCPSSQVVSVVVDSCKEKKKKFLENIPFEIQVLIITIYDPGHSVQVVEADWPDVLAYINGDIPAETFSRLIRYYQY